MVLILLLNSLTVLTPSIIKLYCDMCKKHCQIQEAGLKKIFLFRQHVLPIENKSKYQGANLLWNLFRLESIKS